MDTLNTTNLKDILDTVNQFYTVSYQSLLWLMGILVGLIGLLIPYLQRKHTEKEFEFLGKKVIAETNQIVEGIRRGNEETISRAVTKLEASTLFTTFAATYREYSSYAFGKGVSSMVRYIALQDQETVKILLTMFVRVAIPRSPKEVVYGNYELPLSKLMVNLREFGRNIADHDLLALADHFEEECRRVGELGTAPPP